MADKRQDTIGLWTQVWHQNPEARGEAETVLKSLGAPMPSPQPGPWKGGYEQLPPPGGGLPLIETQGPQAAAPSPPVESEPLGIPDEDLYREAERDPRGAMGKALGTMAGTAVGIAALPFAPELGLLGRLALSTGTGAASGAADMATDAAVTGKPILPAAKEGLKTGAVFGAATQGLGEVAGLGSKAVRGASKWVKGYADARDSGALDRVIDTPGGEPGIQQVADKAQSTIFNRNSEKLGAEGKAHAAAVSESATDQDVGPIVSRLMDLSKTNRTAGSGKIRDKALEDAVNETFDLLDINPAGTARTEDIIAARQAVSDSAQFGQPQTRENAPYRRLYNILREGLHESNPKLAAADEAYSAQANQSERLNDIVARTEATNLTRGTRDTTGAPDLRAGKEVTAAQRLRRIGDETIAGGAEERQLNEVMDMDPVYRRALEDMLAKKSLEATSPGATSSTSERLSRMLSIPGFVKQNARFAGARLIDPLSAGGSRALQSLPYSGVGPLLGPQIDELYNEFMRNRQGR